MTREEKKNGKIGIELSELKRNIIKCDKTKVPNYKFIATVSAGNRCGHILTNGKRYWLCVRKDDIVSYDKVDGIPFGFSRDTIYEIETLAVEMDEQFADEKNNYGGTRRDRFVKPPTLPVTNWFNMTHGQPIINIRTGVIFPLFLPKQCITDLLKLNSYNLNTIYQEGVIVKNFCLYKPPLNKKTWQEIVGKPLRTAMTRTTPGWQLRISGQPDRLYTNFVMQKGKATIQVSNSADLKRIANIESNQLRSFFANGCEGFCNGWELATI